MTEGPERQSKFDGRPKNCANRHLYAHTSTAVQRCTGYCHLIFIFIFRIQTEMLAGGEVAFEAMKVDQLKAELAERGSTRSGRKAILQRRLHALLVQDAIERCGENMDV